LILTIGSILPCIGHCDRGRLRFVAQDDVG